MRTVEDLSSAAESDDRSRVCVVGAGTFLLGGISVYTCRLSNAMADSFHVSTMLMRKIVPTRLYPGGARAGADLTSVQYDDRVSTFDGLDWYWGVGVVRAWRFLDRSKPDVIILQWWTGTVLHSYLAIAAWAKRRGVPVVIEFHEVLDPGEASRGWVNRYVGALLPRLLRRVAGVLVHNDHDRQLVASEYDVADKPTVIASHGPYDHLPAPTHVRGRLRHGGLTFLFFGLIRPYKGLEDLVKAFDALDDPRHRLLIVGETWEGCTAPFEELERARHRDRIDIVNRYVSDAEAADYFARSDVAVFPYRRGSSSGPLHIAMSHGLPVIAYAVGGLIEAVAGYSGAVLVEPNNVDALSAAMRDVGPLVGEKHDDLHSWDNTTSAFGSLFEEIGVRGVGAVPITSLAETA